jgi:hypothetical protein
VAGQAAALSAAAVFLPEHTEQHGKHGSDKFYCEKMHGAVKPWGCKWLEQWRAHVKLAVARKSGSRLQVLFFEGKVGQGKIRSWGMCREDAIKRGSSWPRRKAFLVALPEDEQQRPASLSATPRDDPKGEQPGSERGDAEETLFVASLSADECVFLDAHKGLGNSQKAEVAWLEQERIDYEEADVASFELPIFS